MILKSLHIYILVGLPTRINRNLYNGTEFVSDDDRNRNLKIIVGQEIFDISASQQLKDLQ